ncbi:MAG: M14 family zinc carboxypeptidase [Thermoleophilia bacterium]
MGRRCPCAALIAALACLLPAAPAGAARAGSEGVTVPVPAGWRAIDAPLTTLARPVQRLAVASFPLTQATPDPGCTPETALAALPPDGALVVVWEEAGQPRPELLAGFPARPRRAGLAAPRDHACLGRGTLLRFREGARAFHVLVALGVDAPATRRAETLSVVDGLAVEPLVVGRSRDGRPIRLTVLGDPVARPRVLVVGCIHGDECAAVPVLRRLERAARPRGSLWLVPTLNPDGRVRGTRGNARGVDLNRNFPAGWRPIGGRYESGPRPASEPETRAAMALIRAVRPDVSIWFHQPEVNVRSGGTSEEAARRYSRLVGLPYRALPVPPGAATRWQARRFPASQAFAVELPAGPLDGAGQALHARAVRALAGAGG